MVEKVKMVIEVDLQCCRCYKKIKNVLCKFPEIQDTIYDEKKNTVTITVVCCSPEKIKQKICCKGGKCIKCIKIIIPKKDLPPPPPPDPVPKPTPPLLLIEVCCLGCHAGCGCRRLTPQQGSKPPPVSNRPDLKPPPPPDPIPVVNGCGCGCHRPAPGPVLNGWCGCGCRRGYYPSRCDYFCEENPSACTIM